MTKHPISIDGFLAYAPELARTDSGFKEEYFENLYKNEENHFWFKVRNQLIIYLLKKYTNFSSFLEIGCGTGYVLKGISSHFPKAELTGSEIFVQGLKFASARVQNATFVQMDARDCPFKDQFDAIGLFDVLEHIQKDQEVLHQINEALKKEGFLILTVPQHQWLWSEIDEYACHILRYSKKDLHQKIEAAGFKIIRSTSFVSTLLPLMLLNRLMSNKQSEFNLPKLMNSILTAMLKIDFLLIKIGFNLPIGGSRILVAQKINKKT